MQTSSLTMLLDYLCNIYLVAFTMCLIGSILREVFDSVKNTDSIRIKKVLVSTIFSSFLVSAFSEWIKDYIRYEGYIFACLMTGMWGYYLFTTASNIKVVMAFVKNLLKHVTTPLGESVKDTIDDLEKTNKKRTRKTTAAKKDTDGE